ncbi:hypothetical protein GGR51DRAFT_395202 [Nemania sp. FL0031]|nr:hypothetical protein GGR51DRAFT_395202 [Nemania sp. FL0031]
MAASRARETMSASAISPPGARVGDPVAPVDETTTFPSQIVWPRQGRGPKWTYGVGQRSRPWSGIPTTVVTHTATVTYTQSPPTTDVSQPLSPSPTASIPGPAGIEISGFVAAGIGVGTGIGLLGIGVAVIYFCRTSSRRRKHQTAVGQASINNETTDDIIWPPYPYPASNIETPLELPTTQEPKEMCAETKPLEKDASNRSVIAK